MNIKQATKHIKATIEAYLEKDENGQYPDTRISNIKVLKKEKI